MGPTYRNPELYTAYEGERSEYFLEAKQEEEKEEKEESGRALTDALFACREFGRRTISGFYAEIESKPISARLLRPTNGASQPH